MTWFLIWSYSLCETMFLLTSSFLARYGRPSMIFWAVASPTPGSVANSSLVALFRSIFLLEALFSPVTAFLVVLAAFFVPLAVAEATFSVPSAVVDAASFAASPVAEAASPTLLFLVFLVVVVVVVVVLLSVLDWLSELLLAKLTESSSATANKQRT